MASFHIMIMLFAMTDINTFLSIKDRAYQLIKECLPLLGKIHIFLNNSLQFEILNVQFPLMSYLKNTILFNFQAIKEELEKARAPIEACRASADGLENLCGIPGRMELQKHMEDLDTVLEEIEEGVKERGDELASALEKADKFDSTLHVSNN